MKTLVCLGLSVLGVWVAYQTGKGIGQRRGWAMGHQAGSGLVSHAEAKRWLSQPGPLPPPALSSQLVGLPATPLPGDRRFDNRRGPAGPGSF